MIWLWLGFGVIIVTLLAIDLGLFNRNPHEVKLREAAIWTAVWITVGLSFCIPVYFIYENHWLGVAIVEKHHIVEGGGSSAVLRYLTGYLLEKSLSVDNLFVMAVLFTSFGIEPRYQHRVLYLGILGAIVTRAIMVFGGVWLFSSFDWLFWVFGAYLVVVGLRMLRHQGEEENIADKWYIKIIKKVLPVTTEPHQGRFTMTGHGKLSFTLLSFALVAIELTDVVFALDSIPAILAITTDPFLVLTSNVFAILGLRSLYFVLARMLDQFDYLRYSLAVILCFIGIKMILSEHVHIPTWISLGVIVVALAGGIVGSLLKARHGKAKP